MTFLEGDPDFGYCWLQTATALEIAAILANHLGCSVAGHFWNVGFTWTMGWSFTRMSAINTPSLP
jgi:hypothetical protein